MSRILLLCAALCLVAGASLCVWSAVDMASDPRGYECLGTDDEPAGCP